MAVFWTDKLVKMMREIARTPAAAGDIATEMSRKTGLDITRYSVIAAARRHGVRIETQHVAGHRAPPKVAAATAARTPHDALRAPSAPSVLLPSERRSLGLSPALRGIQAINLVPPSKTILTECPASKCRWPMWGHKDRPLVHEQFVCAAPVAVFGRPYCAAHTEMAGPQKMVVRTEGA